MSRREFLSKTGAAAVATGAGAQWHIAIHHVVRDESGLEAGL